MYIYIYMICTLLPMHSVCIYIHIHTCIGCRDWKHPRCVSTEWPRCCQQVRTRSSGFRCRTRVTCSSFWPRPMGSRWSLLIRKHTHICVFKYMQIYECSWVACHQCAVCGFAMCSVLFFWCVALAVRVFFGAWPLSVLRWGALLTYKYRNARCIEFRFAFLKQAFVHWYLLHIIQMRISLGIFICMYSHTHTQGSDRLSATAEYIYKYIHVCTHTHTHVQGGDGMPAPALEGTEDQLKRRLFKFYRWFESYDVRLMRVSSYGRSDV